MDISYDSDKGRQLCSVAELVEECLEPLTQDAVESVVSAFARLVEELADRGVLDADQVVYVASGKRDLYGYTADFRG